MKKNLKKLMNIASTVAMAYLFTTGAAFANIRVFNNSFTNQAGMSQDIYLDTWDYLANPAFYNRLKNNSFSTGVTNEGQLTGAANTVMFGARANVGLPLYLIGATYNNSGLLQDNTGSYTTAGGVKTDSATTKANQQDYRHRIAVGSDFGILGVQLFADINALQGANFKNSSMEYNNPNATAATLQKESWTSRTQESPNRFGLNLGGEVSSGIIWQFGAALVQRGGSTYEASTADGTQSTKIENGLSSGGALAAVQGLTGIAALTGAASGFNAPITSSSAVGVGGVTSKGVNKALGHEANLLVYIPMGLINANDRLGIGLSHSGATTFSQGDFSANFKNAATLTDITYKTAHKSDGIGTVNAGVNYATTFGDVNSASFTLIPTLGFLFDNGGTTYTPTVSGKCAGATVATPNGGVTTGGACDAAGVPYMGGNMKSYQVSETNYAVTLSMPVLFKYKINSVLTMFAGTNPVVTMSNNKKTVTSTAANATQDVSETISNNGSNFTTSVSYAVGGQIRPIENFRINLMAASSAGRSDLTQVAISADYLFGSVSSGNNAAAPAVREEVKAPVVAPAAPAAPAVKGQRRR